MFVEKHRTNFSNLAGPEQYSSSVFCSPENGVFWVLRQDQNESAKHFFEEPYAFKSEFDEHGKPKNVLVHDLVLDGTSDDFFVIERSATIEEMVYFANRLKLEDSEEARKVVDSIEERVKEAVQSLGLTSLNGAA